MMLEKQERDEALRLLKEAYPDAKPALHFRTPFELLVATMLSAQCTDKQVNKVTDVLYTKYATAEDFAAIDYDTLEPYIHSCGFFRTKGQNILAMARILCEKYGGQVPKTMDELTALPGVGRKTANVVLANAFGVPAIAVDTHVFRVTNRIGLAEAKDVEKTEQQLMENIPKEDWSAAHHWLIYHGRQVCSAQRPKCEACTLAGVCDYRNARRKAQGE